MKIIGYGICGPGESKRYMRETLDCFKRLCDEVIILCNNAEREEIDLIREYGFKVVLDRREWGRFQWRIKQDFIERDIKQTAQVGDMLVCLDMDEVFSSELTKEWIRSAPLDAYHVFIVDLWNDPEHYKPESSFWNVRMWKWNGETKFKQKPVHCGLAPEWTYYYHRHAPFILKHYGLMLPEDRARKVVRYEKYDPKAEYLDRSFYNMLKQNNAKPFNEAEMQDIVSKEVATYQQTKPRTMPTPKKDSRFAWIKNPHGETLDIPERHVKETLARKGFEFIGWADDAQKEIEDLFEDEDIEGSDETDEKLLDPNEGSYQRSTRAQKQEFDALNARDDAQLNGEVPTDSNTIEDDAPLLDEEDAELLLKDGPEDSEIVPQAPTKKVETKKAPAKKPVKKAQKSKK